MKKANDNDPEENGVATYRICNCIYTNVRKGPSINDKIVTAICSGAIVKVYSWTQNGWGRIELDGRFGYVQMMYLEPYNEVR